MKKLNEKEIKEKELNILIYIDKVCRENKINYFLAYGTLIGAVRHKGFIPWDDDIDIVMKREDYNKFIEVFGHENDNFKLLNVNKDKDYYYPFLKVVDKSTKVIEEDFKEIIDLGVWVDIFPLENYNKNLFKVSKVEGLKSKLLLSRSKKFIKAKKNIRTIIKYFMYLIYKDNNPKKYGLKLNELGEKSKLIESNEYCVLFPPKLKKNIFKKEWYMERIECNFEGHKFFIPKMYDEILTSYYGNYMKLPSKNKRTSGHNIKVFYRD